MGIEQEKEKRKAGDKGRKKLEEDKKGGEKISTKEGKKEGKKRKSVIREKVRIWQGLNPCYAPVKWRAQ